MPSSQLNAIRYVFPQHSPETAAWLDAMIALLVPDAGAERGPDHITLRPPYPAGAQPVTTLELGDVTYPHVVLEHETPIHVTAGDLVLRSTAVAPPPDAPTLPAPPIQATEQVMTPGDLARRLAGHILCVDHTGVELPSNQVSREDWDDLLHALAGITTLYRYPEGQDWPFIVPATADEFAADITRFDAPRTPKFELTYGYVERPLLQFHLDTDLPRVQLELRLPEPYGFALPGVETFRSLYLAHPWPDLTIRVDLTFWAGGDLTDWDSGEWLVKDGGRIRA